MASSAEAFSVKILEACEAGETFVKEFYSTVDRRRNLLSGFYSDTSFMVWNGHTHTGSANISNFYQSLPTSEHEVTSFDCQPLNDGRDQTQVLVSCSGQVLFDTPTEGVAGMGGASNFGSNPTNFHQSFILVKHPEYWKIDSDCFRFQEL
ncbi:PREDICTED: NTF2-related export protein 1-like [Amphimedon queenslandica]|uniref:NTF2-related export protein n=1 Tax=Amphimedon queenslandica TaxID=400682 RepID=A0A1X7UK75_AMPQE|nr:PREDICTED: NTF2-related export protein 1-like [Amphimedon queenslandica]|eukprot:XP_011404882.1 PREDICTED: NTF2-related export protein 1-like [Amphimedon queenslandica]